MIIVIDVQIALIHKLNTTNMNIKTFKPEVFCPKKKTITFINEHKRQIIKKYYNCLYGMFHC